jgi:hypothetical protein
MLSRRQLMIAMGVAAAALPSYLYGVQAIGVILDRGPADTGSANRLDEKEQALVTAMAEGIIPATDTPGAKGAGVPAFINLLFEDWFLPEEQIAFRNGLQSFEAASQARFKQSFVQCSPEQQLTLLSGWDHEVARARSAGPPPYPPFAQFKSLTVVGYYTSQIGQTQELKTVLDAGESDPNGPVMMPVPFRL